MTNKSIIITLIIIFLIVPAVIYFFSRATSFTSSTESGTYSPLTSGENPPPTPIPPAPKPITTPAHVQAPFVHSVTIQNFAFNQSSIAVKQGDIVEWTNKDSALHTVTGGSGGPNSGTLNQNQTYSFTFNAVGSFPYHCNFHPSMMAVVRVEPYTLEE